MIERTDGFAQQATREQEQIRQALHERAQAMGNTIEGSVDKAEQMIALMAERARERDAHR